MGFKTGILSFREEVTKRALGDRRITDAAFRVLVAMLGHVNGEEYKRAGKATCWPGIERLADQLGKNQATIKRAVALLVEVRAIATVARGTRKKRATMEISLRWLGGQGELFERAAAEKHGANLSHVNGRSGRILDKNRAQISIPSIDDSDEEPDEGGGSRPAPHVNGKTSRADLPSIQSPPGIDSRFAETVANVLLIVDNPPHLANFARVGVWLQEGADPELDIYPAVRETFDQKRLSEPDWYPRQLNYFDQPVLRAKLRRLAPMPQPAARQGRRRGLSPDQVEAAIARSKENPHDR